MAFVRYIQIFKNIFNPQISVFSDIINSTVDKKTKISRFVKLFNCSIDAHSYIGAGSKLFFTKIGKFCSIGGDCKIGLASHPLNFISTSPIFYSSSNITGESWCKSNGNFRSYQPVIIENDVWIGSNVIIMGGVKINNGAVIGAGAVVTKEVPPYAIVGGIPAKIIKYRFPEETIQKLLESKWWNRSDQYIKNNIHLFSQNLTQSDNILNINNLNSMGGGCLNY